MHLILLILIILALVALALGLKLFFNGIINNIKAIAMIKKANYIFNKAQNELIAEHQKTQNILNELGKLKLMKWHSQLKQFLVMYLQIKNVELEGFRLTDELKNFKLAELNFKPNELLGLKDISMKPRDLAETGALCTGASVVTGMAALGTAKTLGVASTGTAISTLSGAAASKATWAWFGWGALAKGGLGMATGMTIFGGLCAAPAIYLGAKAWNDKANENYANAQITMSQAEIEVKEMTSSIISFRRIVKASKEVDYILSNMQEPMDGILNELEYGIGWGTDYKQYRKLQRKVFHKCVQFAQVMQQLLETPILNPDGSSNNEYDIALEKGRIFLKSDNVFSIHKRTLRSFMSKFKLW